MKDAIKKYASDAKLMKREAKKGCERALKLFDNSIVRQRKDICRYYEGDTMKEYEIALSRLSRE